METYLQTSLEAYLSSGQFSLLSVALVYLAGVLTSTTPCVYPMIPITLGVFSLETGNIGTKRKLAGPLLYVAGLALVYAALGVFAAASGSMFGEISTSPAGYILMANICFVLALSMLGWLRIPQWQWGQAWLGQLTNPYLKFFFTGAASGLVAAPCTAPVLAMLLMYIASTGDVLYGGVLMVSFAYGLGSLLLLFAFSSQWLSRLPKSGRWLNVSKVFMALLMVFTGEYFLTEAGKLLF